MTSSHDEFFCCFPIGFESSVKEWLFDCLNVVKVMDSGTSRFRKRYLTDSYQNDIRLINSNVKIE